MNNTLNIEALKNEFKNLLLSTNRKNISNFINWLETHTDFFDAPSSANYHGNHKHGLLIHSMNVYNVAKKILSGLSEINSSFANITNDSVIIAALLHDMCKVNFYNPCEKWRKNEMNQWESYQGYNISDSFPFGHGEKSVLLLQMAGLEMTPQEMLAIRWHMGAWDGGLLTNDTKISYNNAMEKNPLCIIIQCADNISSMTLETKI